MKIRILALLIAVALAAGCGSAAAPVARQSSTPTVVATPHAPAAAPLSCKQQSDQWKARHRRLIRRFKNSLKPFDTGTVTSAQARALASAAQGMIDAPIPVCADPKGYYRQMMANLVTASTGAQAPLEKAVTLLRKLRAELKQTIGSSKL